MLDVSMKSTLGVQSRGSGFVGFRVQGCLVSFEEVDGPLGYETVEEYRSSPLRVESIVQVSHIFAEVKLVCTGLSYLPPPKKKVNAYPVDM